jgi:hypothetical protein
LFTKDLISSPLAKEDVGEWVTLCPSLEAMNRSILFWLPGTEEREA